MATTETKTGFRLPWSQDHTETDEPSGDAGAVAEATAPAPAQTDADASASQRPKPVDRALMTPLRPTVSTMSRTRNCNQQTVLYS